MDNWRNIPSDRDTRTLKSQNMNIAGYKCVFEMWSWDGILGTSFIFDKTEISALSEPELTSLVTNSLGEIAGDLEITQSRKGSYVFVNVFFPDNEGHINDAPKLTDEDLQIQREKRDQWVREHNASEANKN